MDTELNNTVVLGARRSPSAAPAHQSEPAKGAVAASPTVNNLPSKTNSGSGDGATTVTNGNGSNGGASASAGLEQALQDLNGYVQNVQRNLQFDVDDTSGHTVIRVVDSETAEVIRQIPSEEVLALARHLKSMGEGEQGLFLKEKA
jgi:flagellar protein FlaG